MSRCLTRLERTAGTSFCLGSRRFRRSTGRINTMGVVWIDRGFLSDREISIHNSLTAAPRKSYDEVSPAQHWLMQNADSQS